MRGCWGRGYRGGVRTSSCTATAAERLAAADSSESLWGAVNLEVKEGKFSSIYVACKEICVLVFRTRRCAGVTMTEAGSSSSPSSPSSPRPPSPHED